MGSTESSNPPDNVNINKVHGDFNTHSMNMTESIKEKMNNFQTNGELSSSQDTDNAETHHLKELLLLNLKLIEQQHELLDNKDRQIKALKNEKHAVGLPSNNNTKLCLMI